MKTINKKNKILKELNLKRHNLIKTKNEPKKKVQQSKLKKISTYMDYN